MFAYIRVSGKGQAKDGKDGFVRQKQAIDQYAKTNQLEIVDYFYENHTGTEQHRPELAKLMLSLEQNGHGIDTVIVERLDRLARDLMIQEAIIKDFTKNDFVLISTIEGKDLSKDDPTRKLIRQVMGAFAEYDKTMLVAKLWAAKERKRAKTGKYAGGRTGYKETNSGQELIATIKQLRRKGNKPKRMTWQQIADYLNSNGIRTMDGKQWTLYRVQQTAKPAKKKRKKK